MGTKLQLGFAAVMALAAAGFYGWMKYGKHNFNYVVFDNTTDKAVDLAIDGKTVGTIAPGKSLLVKPVPGHHQVEARAGGAVLESGAFEIVPPKDNPTVKAIYEIGDQGHYVVVKVSYTEAGGFGPLVTAVAEDSHFHLLPYNTDPNGLDTGFPDEVTTNHGEASVELVHVCHVDPESHVNGCGVDPG